MYISFSYYFFSLFLTLFLSFSLSKHMYLNSPVSTFPFLLLYVFPFLPFLPFIFPSGDHSVFHNLSPLSFSIITRGGEAAFPFFFPSSLSVAFCSLLPSAVTPRVVWRLVKAAYAEGRWGEVKGKECVCVGRNVRLGDEECLCKGRKDRWDTLFYHLYVIKGEILLSLPVHGSYIASSYLCVCRVN